LVGNDACFCVTDQPPVAAVEANPTSGQVPLTVHFDASGSTDPDAGDGVAEDTFTFAGGSPQVTPTDPHLDHTYHIASRVSGDNPTVTVSDTKCGQPSLNVASVDIDAQPNTNSVPVAPRSGFGITALSNPAHGATSLALALDHEGLVQVTVYGADGRRIYD